MKKLFFALFTLILFSCAKEVAYQYDNQSRIYFQYTKWNTKGYYEPLDSVLFSFGKHPISVMEDTAKILVKILGDSSNIDKYYNVKIIQEGTVVSGSTTMVEGVHYAPIETRHKFKAGVYTDTLRVLVYRKNLSTSLLKPESRSLILKLEPSDDFQLGIKKGQEVKLSINNILNPPVWWEKNTASLGFYHPKKWLLLIDLDPIFGIEDYFAGTGVDMQNKSSMLKDYLKKNVVIDEETGKRIAFEGLVDL